MERTDNLSAATQEPSRGRGWSLSARCSGVLEHYR